MVKIALLKATENKLREFKVEEDKVFDFITQNSDKSSSLTSINVFGDLKGIDVLVCGDFLNNHYSLNCATATKDVLLFGDVWFVKRNPKNVDLKESLTEEDFSFIKFCFRKAQKINKNVKYWCYWTIRR